MRVAESFENAALTIGKIEKNTRIFTITRGQFSMIDAILHTIDQIGPCHISLWTWKIASYEVSQIDTLLQSKKIMSAALIIDRSAEKNDFGIMREWREKFGIESVRVVRNHAKIARVWTNDLHVLLRGSMNLNFNPRFEQLDLSEGGPEFDMVKQIESEIPILRPNASNQEIDKASQLGLAFDTSTLKQFHGVKVWAK